MATTAPVKEQFIFTTQMNGTRFALSIIKGQAIENKLSVDLDSAKLTGPVPKLTRYPVGSIFITDDFTLTDGQRIHINDYVPLIGLDNILIKELPVESDGTLTSRSSDFIKYYVSLGVELEDIKEDDVKEFIKQVEKEYKYSLDFEKFKEDLEKIKGVRFNIKKFITKNHPVPKEADCGFYVNPDTWHLLARNVLKNENTMITGPTGSGKTEVTALLAKTMGLDLNIQDMGTVQDAQSALLGVHRLNDKGTSIFDPAPFISHVQKKGILLLDEINRAPLAANNILFPALDRRRYIPLDIAASEEERKVKVHEEAVFFATANLGAEFSGTFQIDRALTDRFFPVEMDYPKEDAEARILVLRTGIETKIATSIVKCCANIRKNFKEGDLSNTVSVRHSLQMAQLIADGFKTDQAMLAVLLPLFEDGLTASSERSKIKSIIVAF